MTSRAATQATASLLPCSFLLYYTWDFLSTYVLFVSLFLNDSNAIIFVNKIIIILLDLLR